MKTLGSATRRVGGDTGGHDESEATAADGGETLRVEGEGPAG